MSIATTEIVKLFLAVAGQMRNRFEREFDWPGQMLDGRIIEALIRDGPTSSRALCEVLKLEKSTLSVALKRLEAAEYICREQGRRRAETIHVLPERIAKTTAQIQSAYSSCGDALAALSSEQQSSLGEILMALSNPPGKPQTAASSDDFPGDGYEAKWYPYGDNPNPEHEEGRDQFLEQEEEEQLP